jgi:hypothetical protein
LKPLSPDLAIFENDKIEIYLAANARPPFPCTLAVAKLVDSRAEHGHPYGRGASYVLEVISGLEADGWRKLAEKSAGGSPQAINQVQFINPLLGGASPDLKRLRDAAAMLHAPVLLVYVQNDDRQSGYNDAAMAYWTLVGLFVVPGNTVGHYTTCQALLVDTRTGLIYATAEGEAKREENVLPGAVGIATPRVEQRARAEAVAELQANVEQTLTGTWLTGLGTGQ